MIFRRGKKKDPEADEAAGETGADTYFYPGTEDIGESGALTANYDDTSDADTFDVAELDAQNWRTSGPYDISEIDHPDDGDDLLSSDDEPRIDLGSMILTGFPGAELRLQVAEETSQIVSAMLISDNSALELGAYAAPRSGGLWAELRDEMIEGATEAGGEASLAPGPFGVELRRLLPVTTPEGEEGYQPSRMWVVEGPRWLLRGIVYGEAALTDSVEPPVAQLVTAFRQVVVRRGDEAMAPGDLLPLSMPENLVASEAE